MLCQNCGSQIPDRFTFCPTCGAAVKQAAPQIPQTAFAPDVPTEKTNMDTRTQHIIALFCGLVTLILASAAVYMFAGFFGNAAIAGTGTNTIFLIVTSVLYIGIALILIFAADKQNDGRKANSTAFLVFSILQVLLIISLLLGLLRLVIGRFIRDDTYFFAISGARHLGASVLVGSLAAILIRLLTNKLSLKMMIIIDAIMLVVSIGLMALMTYGFHFGILLMFWCIGPLQALCVFLPCIGKWNETVYAAQNAYAPGYTMAGYPASGQMRQSYTMGQSYSQEQSYGMEQPYVQQMFCPNCGARFSGQKKFCDQCGTQLSVLKAVEGQMQGQMPGQPPGQMMGPGGQGGVNPMDAPSGGYAALGFFIPVVGLILFLTWQYTFPLRAKSAGKGALAGVITTVVLGILLVILEVVLMSGALYF